MGFDCDNIGAIIMEALGFDLSLGDSRWDAVDVLGDTLLYPLDMDDCSVRFDMPNPPMVFDSPLSVMSDDRLFGLPMLTKVCVSLILSVMLFCRTLSVQLERVCFHESLYMHAHKDAHLLNQLDIIICANVRAVYPSVDCIASMEASRYPPHHDGGTRLTL